MTDSDNSKDTVNSSAIPADDAPEDEHDTPMADDLAGLTQEIRRLERQTSGFITDVEVGGGMAKHTVTIAVPPTPMDEVATDGGTQELPPETDARERDDFEAWHANTEPDAPEVRETILRVVRQLASAHRDGVPAGDVLDLTGAKTGASVRTVASVQAECIAAGELVETDAGCLKFVRGDGA